MNLLIENGKISEMSCGTNFSYILQDNALFLPTEYKVLQSQKEGSFVKCMKMLYNGRIQLYYFSGEYKSLAALLPNMDADSFLTIIGNLFAAIIGVHNNGFLTCRNIDISFDRIYVDTNTYKVSLIYLPIKERLFSDDAEFENEVRTELIKLISGLHTLSTPKMMQVAADLQNGALSMEAVYARLSGKKTPPGAGKGNQPAPSRLRLTAMNAPARFEMTVNKSEFLIGKRDTNDGVVAFNKLISRVHCKITRNGGQYFVTDLQSSNGTYVNHRKLQPNQPFPLKSGDVIRMANSDFQAVIE